mgnify:CR=1 FL=1
MLLDFSITLPRLEAYFSAQDKVILAYLFGSQARGAANALSDVDIADYFRKDSAAL